MANPADAEFESAADADEASYSHIVLTTSTTNAADLEVTMAVHRALREAGYPVVRIVDTAARAGSGGAVQFRTNLPGGDQRRVLDCLALGLLEATRAASPSESAEPPMVTAQRLLSDFAGHAPVFAAFREYYSSMRWSSDQDRFAQALIEHGTDFDPEVLDRHMTPWELSQAADELGFPDDESTVVRTLTVRAALKRYPALDFRRLSDLTFAASDEGKRMTAVYAHICGMCQARRYGRRRIADELTAKGEIDPTPSIPLSRYPVIEALLVGETGLDAMRAGAIFGPEAAAALIVRSDSGAAHRAMREALCHRLPVELRPSDEDLGELGQKADTLRTIIREVRDRAADPVRREMLTTTLLAALDAYTGKGATAASVRTEALEALARGRHSRDGAEVRETVAMLLRACLASGDIRLSARAEEVIEAAVRDTAQEDPVGLSLVECMTVVLDALEMIEPGSSFSALGRAAHRVFGSVTVAARIATIAETKRDAARQRSTRPLLAAHYQVVTARSEASIKRAELRRDQLAAPAAELSAQARQATRTLEIDLLEWCLDQEAVSTWGTLAYRLFEEVVSRVSLNDPDARTIPADYKRLVAVAEDPRLPGGLRNRVLWRFYESWKSAGEPLNSELAGVVLDIYRIVLGPLDAIREVGPDDGQGLAVASALVAEHSNRIFRSAVDDVVPVLAEYANVIRARAWLIATGGYLGDGTTPRALTTVDEEVPTVDWRHKVLRNLESVARQLSSIEERYEKHLRLQTIRTDPIEYYTWMLEQFDVFWGGMGSEMSPGNQPDRDVRGLYEALREIREHGLVRPPDVGYPATFDPIADGALGTLLAECYRRMVIPREIQYNTTVWQRGLPFVHAALRMMPTSLAQRLAKDYAGTDFGRGVARYANPAGPQTEVL